MIIDFYNRGGGGGSSITSGDVQNMISSALTDYTTTVNTMISSATTNCVVSTDVTTIVEISQADYDLLPTKDSHTFYAIPEE